ncbi:MAG: hypothetical protein IK078_03920 [Lachnospiraceae bacterium]|nr:hypothetical protein [Lachnospiraceae bacterium]
MQKKPTDELNAILENTRPGQMDRYLKENRDYLALGEKAFYYHMKDTVEEKNIRLKDIYITAGVKESYGSKILRMERHTKNRDLILRFCIAGHFSLNETNRALKLYKMNELYAKDPRDACIIVAINNRIFDLGTIDDMLEKQKQKKLSVDEK